MATHSVEDMSHALLTEADGVWRGAFAKVKLA